MITAVGMKEMVETKSCPLTTKAAIQYAERRSGALPGTIFMIEIYERERSLKGSSQDLICRVDELHARL